MYDGDRGNRAEVQAASVHDISLNMLPPESIYDGDRGNQNEHIIHKRLTV